MEGWIKIYRKIMNWEWFDVPEMVALWVHLLINANLEEKVWHGINIPRGSFVTSRKALAEESGLTEQNVRTCLSRLISTNEITIKSTNKYTMVTINNFDNYQPRKEDYQPAEQPTIQQSTNQQLTTTKEYKNIDITDTNAPARDSSSAGSWRFVTSVQRFALHNNPDKIAEFKRDLFRREVEVYAVEVGMPARDQEKFVSWWTEHDPGKEKIRAEFENVFNIPDRMRTWMDRNTTRGTQPAQKSRMDSLQDDMNFIHEFFNGKQQSTAAPDEQ